MTRLLRVDSVLLAAALAVGACLNAAATLRGDTVQIDAAATEQVIRGFGGATVFLPTTPLTDGDLDTLFGNGPGQIGLTLLRIRVASDPSWRPIELSNARGAIARGASVIATPWSPPAAMKDNNSIVAGSLLASAYADYAKYLNGFAAYMSTNGAPLYAISVQNEPDISVTYESCDWTPAQMLTFCHNNANAIWAAKVIMPESYQFRHAMSDPVLNDPVAAANIAIVGGHIYGGGLVPYPLAVSLGKEVWMTEHLDLSTDWAGALGTAKEIHDCLVTGNFSAYFWWYLRRYYGPLGEDSVVTKRGYVMAQFAKFIRPGFVRVDATATPTPGISVSAFARDHLVVVAVNQNASDVTQAFAIAHATVGSVTPWLTSSSANLAAQTSIPVSSGSFSATLPAQSVTTFVGDLPATPPSINVAPQPHLVAPGSTVVLDVGATGSYPNYQWSHNGAAITGATDHLLTLRDVAAADGGNYSVTVSNPGGAVTSPPATLSVANAGSMSRLINLSTRSPVATGDNVQIAGFVIAGTAPKRVLIRAAGPALNAVVGLTGTLPDPKIEVHDAATGSVVASNDNWDAPLAATFASVGAFPWPAGSHDAALVATLPPGGYTAIVSDGGGGSGIALVEVYDADVSSPSVLSNLSTRSFVGTSDNVQIGGFVIAGATAKTVVIRASGPTLGSGFGVGGALSDPEIELRRQEDNQPVASSSSWNPDLAAHFATVGAFGWPLGSQDAALVATLDPGGYTVVVRGNANDTGVALIEIYAEP